MYLHCSQFDLAGGTGPVIIFMKSESLEAISSGLRGVGNQLHESSRPKFPEEFPRTFTGDQTRSPAVETLIGAALAGFSRAKAYASS